MDKIYPGVAEVDTGSSVQAALAGSLQEPPSLGEEDLQGEEVLVKDADDDEDDNPWKGNVAGEAYKFIPFSILRVEAVVKGFNWMRPFSLSRESVGLGTGWVAATEPEPLFVTNAHVVRNARSVNVQFPAVTGHKKFLVKVVLISPSYDLALLRLASPQAYRKTLTKNGQEIRALKLAAESAGPPPMGLDVVALGFPLGQESVKISRGVISGTHRVNGHVCIQSTAPLAPGNSGGPLLTADGKTVVGVNFAKSIAAGSENINFVIPAWRIRQMVSYHLAKYKTLDAVARSLAKRERVKLMGASLDVTSVQANHALYASSGGCWKGVFLAKIQKRSILRFAEEGEVPSGSFLEEIDGLPVDKFGAVRNPRYVDELVDFRDMFTMRSNLPAAHQQDSQVDRVHLKICRLGEVKEFVIPLKWHPEMERGIKRVYEPLYETEDVQFELFGDIGVMPMTVNHIRVIQRVSHSTGPSRWLHPDAISQPRLIVSYVRPGSYASKILNPGASVKAINGRTVSTLQDFRDFFVPSNYEEANSTAFHALQPGGDEDSVWTLETESGKIYAVNFEATLHRHIKNDPPHMITEAVKQSATEILKFESPHSLAKRAQLSRSKQERKASLLTTEGVVALGPLEVNIDFNGEYRTDAVPVTEFLVSEDLPFPEDLEAIHPLESAPSAFGGEELPLDF